MSHHAPQSYSFPSPPRSAPTLVTLPTHFVSKIANTARLSPSLILTQKSNQCDGARKRKEKQIGKMKQTIVKTNSVSLYISVCRVPGVCTCVQRLEGNIGFPRVGVMGHLGHLMRVLSIKLKSLAKQQVLSKLDHFSSPSISSWLTWIHKKNHKIKKKCSSAKKFYFHVLPKRCLILKFYRCIK